MTQMVSLTDDLVETVHLVGPIAEPEQAAPDDPIQIETWAEFERSATEQIPTLIDGLWPEGAFGFVAAPPKKGKTWIGLSLAISIAGGVPAFGHFNVRVARPVIYLALEGHKAAIRGRVGCLARGMGLNPDTGDDLNNLHIIYKPRGLNLADPGWVATLRATIHAIEPAIVVVDVLRAAAAIKESSNDDFGLLRRTLQPISDDGISIALLHHFGKLTEITKERSAGERMAGAGAMYGAMDAGIFITGSDDGARKLRVEFELRDLATPDPLGLHLDGRPSGINGGFIYTDSAYWKIEEAPDESDVTANASEVAAWLAEQDGRTATTAEIAYAFGCSEKTVDRRRHGYVTHGIEYVPKKGKTPAHYYLPLLDMDTPDNVQQPLMSKQETRDMQGKDGTSCLDMDTLDKTQCPDEKVAGLQAKPLMDTMDSLTESSPPAVAEAAPPADLAYYDHLELPDTE